MARVIVFYIPDSYVSKARPWMREEGRVIEFPEPEPASESKNYVQPTWVFPEVDADLSLRQG
jgi:hypothetical protein